MKTSIDNSKLELNPHKVGAAFHGELLQAKKLEKLSQECEQLGKDETVPLSCRETYMQQSVAFAGLAATIYSICAPLNQPSHV